MSKKSYNELSYSDKLNLIKESTSGTSQRFLATKYKISKGQVFNILKKKNEIIESGAANVNVSRQRLNIRKSVNEEINILTYEFFCQLRSKNIPVSGPMLKEKALFFAESLDIGGFKASDGWLECFKKRHNIDFRVLSGESGSVDRMVTENWKCIISSLTKDYLSTEIFNADETGLFFRALPNISLAVKGVECKGGKLSKERLTVLLCVSLKGEKLPPLVIGKNQKPRCFKNIKNTALPTKWCWNTKAWMTGALFTEWLNEVNRKMQNAGRNIILFIDNAPCHPSIILTNIKVCFFPANCTSILQPLDQGIIRSIKCKYRKYFLRKLLINIEEVSDVSELVKRINVLDSIHWIQQAWTEVSKMTIENCFKKAGFVEEITNNVEISTEEDEDIRHLSELMNTIGISQISPQEYVDLENSCETTQNISNENVHHEILEQFMEERNKMNSDESDYEDSSEIQTTINSKIFSNYLLEMKNLIAQKDPDFFNEFVAFEKKYEEYSFKRRYNGSQATIDSFFKNE